MSIDETMDIDKAILRRRSGLWKLLVELGLAVFVVMLFVGTFYTWTIIPYNEALVRQNKTIASARRYMQQPMCAVAEERVLLENLHRCTEQEIIANKTVEDLAWIDLMKHWRICSDENCTWFENNMRQALFVPLFSFGLRMTTLIVVLSLFGCINLCGRWRDTYDNIPHTNKGVWVQQQVVDENYHQFMQAMNYGYQKYAQNQNSRRGIVGAADVHALSDDDATS